MLSPAGSPAPLPVIPQTRPVNSAPSVPAIPTVPAIPSVPSIVAPAHTSPVTVSPPAFPPSLNNPTNGFTIPAGMQLHAGGMWQNGYMGYDSVQGYENGGYIAEGPNDASAMQPAQASTSTSFISAHAPATSAPTETLASNNFPHMYNYTQDELYLLANGAALHPTSFTGLLSSSYASPHLDNTTTHSPIHHGTGILAPPPTPTEPEAAPAVDNSVPSPQTSATPVPPALLPRPLSRQTIEDIINPDGQLRSGERFDPSTLLPPNTHPTHTQLLEAALEYRGLSREDSTLIDSPESPVKCKITCVVCSKKIMAMAASRALHRNSAPHTRGWENILWLRQGSLKYIKEEGYVVRFEMDRGVQMANDGVQREVAGEGSGSGEEASNVAEPESASDPDG